MRFRRRKRKIDAGVYSGFSAVQLGVISPDQLQNLVNDLTVKGLTELVPWVSEETGVTVEPGSFFMGLVWATASTTGLPREVIAEMLVENHAPEMVERIRAEV